MAAVVWSAWVVWLSLGGVLSPRLDAASVAITEFLADNASSIADERGEREDWIELYNAGDEPVSLEGWSLTDDAERPTKWQFPSTNIGPAQFLIVWASGRDARVPGQPLHANFRLSADGEYLGLHRPDGLVASEFRPAFPVQATDLSYGRGVTVATNLLVAAGTPARYWVPSGPEPWLLWQGLGFDDGAWSEAVSGVGFATEWVATDLAPVMANRHPTVYLRVPFTVADPGRLRRFGLRMRYDDGFIAYLNGTEVARRNAPALAAGGEVANSANDWSPTGAPGVNQWFYGYYHRGADADQTYEHEQDFATDARRWMFNETVWSHWLPGVSERAEVEIARDRWRAEGSLLAGSFWAVRRWISPISGRVTVRLAVAKTAPGGVDAAVHLFRNSQLLRSDRVVVDDLVGVNAEVVIDGLDPGDVLDFALEPFGTSGNVGLNPDWCAFRASIVQEAATDPAWDSRATGPADATALQAGETFDLTAYREALVAGDNVLAIQGLNLDAADPDFGLLPELWGEAWTIGTTDGYLLAPTPGAPNGPGGPQPGPLIVETGFEPVAPTTDDTITVRARLRATLLPVAGLDLTYRVMFGEEVTVPMHDDGAHGDGLAHDGNYAGAIPAGVAGPGEMVRWYLTSRDTAGARLRSPPGSDPERSPQYHGTVIVNPALTTPLPVFHWFVESPAAAATKAGTRASIYFNGQFLDNVEVNLHGQSSAWFPKQSFNFGANPGHKLVWNPDAPAIGGWALLTTWADRAHYRNILTAEQYAWSEVPVHFCFGVRVQQNGAFHSVANFMERGDEEFLERLGFDPNGALYKMYNNGLFVRFNEKKTRRWESVDDLAALMDAVTIEDPAARSAYLYDHINLPEVVNMLAAKVVPSDHDCCHKNYYLYHDVEGSDEWYAFPWDFDLSWGHVYGAEGRYLDDAIVAGSGPFYGTSEHPLFTALWSDPGLRSMVTRRARTLMDAILQPPETPPESDFLRARIAQLEGELQPDADLDYARWYPGPEWIPPVDPPRTLANESGRIKDLYLPGRRQFLFQERVATGEIPEAQPASATLEFGVIEANPVSGNQAEEFIEIVNPNDFAVDLTSWELRGAVRFRFRGGTVIPAATSLFVSPDVKAFRARTRSPKAGERRLVVGPYEGHLSARGETIELVAPDHVVIQTLVYPGAPSPAQQALRVTELMYDPPPGGSFEAQEYEYLELKNVSTESSLDLAGIRLLGGVDFRFNDPAAVLPPGARVVLVRNAAAFAKRYGSDQPVAGVFSGALNSQGERLRLLDRAGEEILDFDYATLRQPLTDGLGFSLVVVDDQAEPDRWKERGQWRPSGIPLGSPGADDAPAVWPPVRVNEVLSRPEAGQQDALELWNPTGSAVDVGGWFLTDDPDAPFKYRIPAHTILAPDGYIVFTEAQFNAGDEGFAFRAEGDGAFLFSGDGTALTGYAHGFEFNGAESGVSFGRHTNSLGEEAFVAQRVATLGRPNAGPPAGPVAISELMYHPPRQTPVDAPMAYVELLNLTATNIALGDPARPGEGWRLRGGITFDFPVQAVLPASGTVLVVGFDPTRETPSLAGFRSRYAVPPDVPIYGPWSGNLANDHDTVELWKPVPNGRGGLMPVLVERVRYRDAAPWPGLADGHGAALRRITPDAYGDDPANWVAAVPSPGAHPPVESSPRILVQPKSRVVPAGAIALFEVGVLGAEPLSYQWQCNGDDLVGATNATLVVNPVEPRHAGSYVVRIANAQATIASAPALLTVLPGSDKDRDGLSDDWELAHGLDPRLAADAGLDQDHDGLTNLEEFQAGTNPRDPASRLEVVELIYPATPEAPLLIRFAAKAGKTYTVQYQDEIAIGPWQTLEHLPASPVGGLISVEHSPPPHPFKRFYRVVTPAQIE
jgi:hypothetical protein